jgi:hypothetical protein
VSVDGQRGLRQSVPGNIHSVVVGEKWYFLYPLCIVTFQRRQSFGHVIFLDQSGESTYFNTRYHKDFE